MYLGDNMLEQGLSGFVGSFEASAAPPHARGEPAAQILLTEVDNPRSFGVAEIDAKGEVVRLVEKPDRPAVQSGVGGYLSVRLQHPRGGPVDSSRRPVASWRSPTPSSG